MNITLYTEVADLYQSESISTSEENTREYSLDFALGSNYGTSKSIDETLEVLIISNAGAYSFTLDFEVFVTYHILPQDFLTIFYILLGIVLVVFIVLTILIYQHNKTEISNHYAKNKPLDLTLPWFKGRIVRTLMKDCYSTRNWKLGLKISRGKFPEYSKLFHQFRALDFLKQGQSAALQGKFTKTLRSWQEAKKSLEELDNPEWIDILNWLLEPLDEIVTIQNDLEGQKKAAALQKQFNFLSSMKE
jgi:hypothetical protein